MLKGNTVKQKSVITKLRDSNLPKTILLTFLAFWKGHFFPPPCQTKESYVVDR